MNHVAPNLGYLLSLTETEGPDGNPWLRDEEVDFATQMYSDYRDVCALSNNSRPLPFVFYLKSRTEFTRELRMLPSDMAAVTFEIVCTGTAPEDIFKDWGWPVEAIPLITKMALEEMNEAING